MHSREARANLRLISKIHLRMKVAFLILILKISFVITYECGVKKVTQPGALIRGGQTSFPGQWPWLASLHKINNSLPKKSEFFCGSTIISEKTLLTGLGSKSRFFSLFFLNIFSRSLHQGNIRQSAIRNSWKI